MPFKSQAQARLFFAAAHSKGGIDSLKPDMAKKFIADTHHEKLSSLPKYAKLKKKLKGK